MLVGFVFIVVFLSVMFNFSNMSSVYNKHMLKIGVFLFILICLMFLIRTGQSMRVCVSVCGVSVCVLLIRGEYNKGAMSVQHDND